MANATPPAARPGRAPPVAGRGPAAPGPPTLWWRLAVAGSGAAVTSARAAAVVRAAPVAQQLIGDARRDGVYRVVEGVDRDLLRRPEDGRWGDVQCVQGHLRAAPYGGAVGDRRGAGR